MECGDRRETAGNSGPTARAAGLCVNPRGHLERDHVRPFPAAQIATARK